MNFEELIETLSKGSATAVTTLEKNVAELNALKEDTEIDRNLNSPSDWQVRTGATNGGTT